MKLPQGVIEFFQEQGCVLVSTIDEKGRPHSACKGIVGIEGDGRIYLFDLYRKKTHRNLLHNPNISIAAFDEHNFKGYCLKGKARAVITEKIDSQFIQNWENKISRRLTNRLLRNIREEKVSHRYSEAMMPNPEYLIVMEVEEVVDLAPPHLRRKID